MYTVTEPWLCKSRCPLNLAAVAIQLASIVARMGSFSFSQVLRAR